MRRFGEDAVHVVPEQGLQPKRHAAGAAADTAGQIDEQRMVGVHLHLESLQLTRQPSSRDGIAEEQPGRVLVVDEIGQRIVEGLLASGRHGHRIVGVVFDDIDAMGAQQILLPLPGVCGHVHGHPEAELGRHDADRQPEVPGRSDSDGVVAEKLAGLGAVEGAIVGPGRQQSGFDSQRFCVGEHLVDAAAGLDRAADRQHAVELGELLTGQGESVSVAEGLLHPADRHQRRFDDSRAGSRLREDLGQIGREPLQAVGCIVDVNRSQPDRGQPLGRRQQGRIEPGGLAEPDHIVQRGTVRQPVGQAFAHDHLRHCVSPRVQNCR
ncbi:hypothetical protein SDC9_92041 [bioreactor metagenome]|uniref:Uncharacterized protein n=1 Tax=bioreactor metagenome TaxID=1076179 RepID=A0A645A6G7_9ZZZZ